MLWFIKSWFTGLTNLKIYYAAITYVFVAANFWFWPSLWICNKLSRNVYKSIIWRLCFLKFSIVALKAIGDSYLFPALELIVKFLLSLWSRCSLVIIFFAIPRLNTKKKIYLLSQHMQILSWKIHTLQNEICLIIIVYEKKSCREWEKMVIGKIL